MLFSAEIRFIVLLMLLLLLLLFAVVITDGLEISTDILSICGILEMIITMASKHTAEQLKLDKCSIQRRTAAVAAAAAVREGERQQQPKQMKTTIPE